MNIVHALILLIVVGSMATLISPIVDMVFRQRRARRVSESPVSPGRVGWLVKATEGLLRAFTASGTPQRRLARAFVAFIIGIQGFHSLAAYAATNLIQNPSAESANAAGTLPLNWSNGKAGTNTTTFTYITNDGHNTGSDTGTKSLYLNMTQRTSGDAKWYPAVVTVKPSTQYTFSGWYKANKPTEIDLAITNTSNATSYITAASPAASSAAWTQVTFSFTTPANSKQLTIFFLAYQVGWLQIDDFSLVEAASPNSPTVSITAPVNGSTVSGTTQAITATASDAVGIAGVQFKVDGANLGAEDTAAPYSANWDTTGLTNCSPHTVSATARNTSNLTATASVAVTAINGPTVSASFTAPAPGATVAGSVAVSASASPTGACGVVQGVQFKVDGNNIGAEDTTSPYAAPVPLDTTTLSNGPHTLTAVVRQSTGSTTATETITVNNSSSPPTVSITSPAAGTVTGTQAINATASDAVGIAGVQFKVDGANFGTEDTLAPYSANWDTTGLQNCSPHTVSATARNTSNLTATASVAVTVRNGPTVSFTAPAAGATVAGSVTVSASTTGACSVAGVQFKVDGNNIGAEDTTSPYAAPVLLDTTTLSNGPHTLTAIGRESTGSTTTATETITVNNPPANPGNIIPNPSVETSSGGKPTDWFSSSYGTNSHTFTYLNTGHTGTHSLRMEITAYTNGGVLWYHTDKPITGGTYLYTEWYQSNVDTEVDADITLSDGTTQSYFLGTTLASAAWRQTKLALDVPANAVSITVYPVLYSKGWRITDDFSLTPYTPAQLNRGLVSINFDDGYTDQYVNAFQALLKTKYGLALPATFYIISGELTDQPTYMTRQQVIDLYANGMEIGSHTITHPSLPTLSQANLVKEMTQSQHDLQDPLTGIGAPVIDFAYPYGDYNGNTIAVGQTKPAPNYQSQRTSDTGFNTKDLLDLTRIKAQGVLNGTTRAQVQAWVDRAKADRTWVILMYHQIEINPTPLPAGDLYTSRQDDLDAELQYLKNSGVGVVTMDQAIKEICAQVTCPPYP